MNPSAPARRQVVWYAAAQVAALGMLALALAWTPVLIWSRLDPETQKLSTQDRPAIVLLALLAGGWLMTLAVARWRRSEVAGILGGITLAVGCWLLLNGHTANPINGMLSDPDAFEQPVTAFIPRLFPVLLGLALMLALWGGIARVELGRHARVGVGALVGGVALCLFSLLMYCLVTRWSGVPYSIELRQITGLLVVALLYPSALWLGNAGISLAARWPIYPTGAVVLIAAFLLHILGIKG